MGIPWRRFIKMDKALRPYLERQKTCDHAGYKFRDHGRCCGSCGIIMMDFGD